MAFKLFLNMLGFVLLGSSVQASTPSLLFICKASVVVDGSTHSMELRVEDLAGPVARMSINQKPIRDNSGYVLHEVDFKSVSASDVKRNQNLKNVALVVGQDLSLIDHALIYDVHYNESGSGAVGVVFNDKSGRPLSRGMLFGWAGVLKCN